MSKNITRNAKKLNCKNTRAETLENVDKIKIAKYIKIMVFEVRILPIVKNEIAELTKEQQEFLKSEYEKIEKFGIEYVKVKAIHSKIFEIKSNELRSLFKYQNGQIIVIGVVFVKKTQKTPLEKIKLAKKRLK